MVCKIVYNIVYNYIIYIYTYLVNVYIAIENGPVEIVDLPINSMAIFHSYVNVYQRVDMT